MAAQRCSSVNRVTQDNGPDINPDGPVPIYMQVADFIAAKIASGEWAPGRRLPGERDLASEWGVAYLTVRRAMQELRKRGLVVTVQGRGNYVSPEA
jgi:GntR family transcriptional regulator